MLSINQTTAPAPSKLSVEREQSGGVRQMNALGQTVLDHCLLKKRLTLVWHLVSAQSAQQLLALLPENTFFPLVYEEEGLNLTCYVLSTTLDRGVNSWQLRAVLMER